MAAAQQARLRITSRLAFSPFRLGASAPPSSLQVYAQDLLPAHAISLHLIADLRLFSFFRLHQIGPLEKCPPFPLSVGLTGWKILVL